MTDGRPCARSIPWRLSPNGKRQLERDNRKQLRQEIDAELAKPLNEPLPAKEKRQIRERVRSGLHPLRGAPW